MQQLPTDLLVKLIISIAVGGMIGLERELRSKSAGFRTMILICLGATLFTIFSKIIGAPGSPDRIASNVVVGVGFLGAGVIFRGETRISGITTAATIWLTAALGIGIGIGYYALSIAGCVLVLVVLFIFSGMDRIIDTINQVREYKIVFPYEANQQHKYEDMIKGFGLTIKARSQSKAGNMIKGTWTVKGMERKHHAFIERVLADNTVAEFNF